MFEHATGSEPSPNGHVVHAQPIVSVHTQFPGGAGSGHIEPEPDPEPASIIFLIGPGL